MFRCSATWSDLKQAALLNVNLSTEREPQGRLPPVKRDAIEGPDLKMLQKTYKKIYAAGRILYVSYFCDKFKHLLYKDCRYTADLGSLMTLVDLLASGSFCSIMLPFKWKVASLKELPTI